MTDRLHARCVLAAPGVEMPRVHGEAMTVLLTEQPPAGAIGLRLNTADAEALRRVSDVLGLDLPLTPNTSLAHSGFTVLWLAHDEWLLLTQDGRQAEVATRLAQALAGRHAALTEVSDLYATIDVVGPASRDLLCKGCAVDLHERSFSSGDLVVTALARVRVVLRQTGAGPAYQILVERSHARYLWDWLVDAAAEFAGG